MTEEKVILVTGGATGIGKATARLLASRGDKVIICGRREDIGRAAIQELSEVGSVSFIAADVSDEASVDRLFDRMIAEHGRLDALVNNAGFSNEYGPLAESKLENFRALIDGNLVGTYLCMRRAILQMQKQGGGAIVNLSSIVGLQAMAGMATYAAVKHAVTGLTRTAAIDYATQNIRINAVAPGATRGSDAEPTPEERAAQAGIAGFFPMQRMAGPAEIAGAIVWLLSDEASFVTGHILSVDGGYTA